LTICAVSAAHGESVLPAEMSTPAQTHVDSACGACSDDSADTNAAVGTLSLSELTSDLNMLASGSGPVTLLAAQYSSAELRSSGVWGHGYRSFSSRQPSGIGSNGTSGIAGSTQFALDSATVVPLPTSVWGGISLLITLVVVRQWRRRRRYLAT
jgi:hypothetical protein